MILIIMTLNIDGINYNDITYNINKCKITYKLLSIVICKVFYRSNQLSKVFKRKAFISIVVGSF
jgi:hypothetical protein